jgi:hypothetical protein
MTKPIKQIINEAIGYASMCWAPQPEGAFCAQEASILADALLSDIEDYVQLRIKEHISGLIEDVEALENHVEHIEMGEQI